MASYLVELVVKWQNVPNAMVGPVYTSFTFKNIGITSLGFRV